MDKVVWRVLVLSSTQSHAGVLLSPHIMVAVSELLYRDDFILAIVFQLLELCHLFLCLARLFLVLCMYTADHRLTLFTHTQRGWKLSNSHIFNLCVINPLALELDIYSLAHHLRKM